MSENADCCKNKLAARRIGGFRILEEIHSDGQGTLYKAVCETPSFDGIEPGAVVALKAMPVVHDEGGRRWTRLQECMNVLSKLSHPGVEKYYGCFRESGPFGILFFVVVMEYLSDMPGSTLRDAIKSAKGTHLSWQEVFGAFARYANALATIHKQGIVHRNIKPSKLYYKPSQFKDCSPDGKILDFTIARDINETQETGSVPGTLDYMPPEVVLTDSRGDPSMDIYALGLSLYEALTGKTAYPRLPSRTAAYAAFLERAKSKTPPTFDLPLERERPELLALLKDMTNIDPAKRISDASEVERRIGEIKKIRDAEERERSVVTLSHENQTMLLIDAALHDIYLDSKILRGLLRVFVIGWFFCIAFVCWLVDRIVSRLEDWFRASYVSGFKGESGSKAVVLPLALLVSAMCFVHTWPLVSLSIIAVIGLAVAAMAWRDWKLGIRINWEEAFNLERFIPMVIEDYAEECSDYDTVKRGEDGPLFWPEKRAAYEQYKSEDDIPSPWVRAESLAMSFSLKCRSDNYNRFRWRIAFVVMSAVLFAVVMCWRMVGHWGGAS